MASHDDRQWLLGLIQNAYITTDDTGVSEVVLQDSLLLKNIYEYPFQNEVYDEFFGNQDCSDLNSPDITANTYYSSHRQRSYTERKSERLKREKEKESRVKKIQWKCNEDLLSDDDLNEAFERKLIVDINNDGNCEGSSHNGSMSLFSQLLQSCNDVNTNPFIEFAKFDGVTHNTGARKFFKIFLYIGPKPSIDYPLRVTVISSAKVSDLIGLIAWLYTRENPHAHFKSIDQYQLHIAEDDGMVDWEFQPLEKRDCIDKYGFTTLALVEQDVEEDKNGVIVTVNFARGEFSKIALESMEVTLEEVLKKSVSRRKDITKLKEAGINYHMERENHPGIELDLEKTVGQVQCLEFAAVRDNSKRVEVRNDEGPSALEITKEHSFRVVWERKISKCETKLVISGDNLKIYPLQMSGGSSLFVSRVPVLLEYKIEQLLECNKKPMRKDRLEVTLTMRGEHSFKIYRFICEQAVGHEIYIKCSHLIRINCTKTASKRPVMRRHNSLSFKKKYKNPLYPYEV